MVMVTTGSAPATSGQSGGQTYRAALAMVTTLFFLWGFVTVRNDILVPHLKSIFVLNTNGSSWANMAKMSTDGFQAYKIQEALSVKMPYTIIGIALILFAVLIGMFKLPPMPEARREAHQKSAASIWKYTHLVLGMVGIFVYVGAEVSIGSFLINYLSQPNIGNLSEVVAAKYVAYYWGGAMVGRFVC